MDKINVMIVDDHPLMRQALQFALEAEGDMRVVGQVANGEEALQALAACPPDVVASCVLVLDLLMPQMDGLETIARLSTCQPSPKILVVSSVEEESVILQALRAGANGYLTKAAERSEIVAAVRAVQDGGIYLPNAITAKVMHALRKSPVAPPRACEPLTKREEAVLELLGQGQSNQYIAETLHIAPATVRVHLLHIMGKLGFEDRHQLVAYAIRQNQQS